MKKKHGVEMGEYAEKTREELASKVHFSKHVIELITLEKYLFFDV